MTRKRFIKLQMAAGCDRNTAEALARRARAAGRSYAEAFGNLTAARSFCAGLRDGVLAPALEAVSAWSTWVRQVVRVATAVGAAFQKAMEESNNER